jgi:hypothetical protein
VLAIGSFSSTRRGASRRKLPSGEKSEFRAGGRSARGNFPNAGMTGGRALFTKMSDPG